MKKLLTIAWLTIISLSATAQSNIPPSIGTVTAFKMNALGINIIFPTGTIQTPVAAELWTTPIATAKKVGTIIPTTEIHGDTVTVKLTAAQVRLIDQLNFYVIFKNTDVVNRKYVIGGIIKTSMSVGMPSSIPYTVTISDIGVVKVSLIGDPSLSLRYAHIADSLATVAKTASTNSTAQADRATAAAAEISLSGLRVKSAGPINKTIVTGRFGAYNYLYSDGTSTGRCYQYTFVPKYDCVGVQLLFGNWSIGSSDGGYAGYQRALNPINIKVSMYIDGYDRAYFNGQDSYKLYPGQTIKTDPDRRFFEAGRPVAVLIWVTVDNLGDKWPLGTYTKNLVAGDEGFATTDVTMGGAITVAIERGYSPFAVIGSVFSSTKKQNILINGDSIFTGINPDPGLDQGWVRRGLDTAGLPWFRFAVGGDQMSQHLNPPYDTRAAYMYSNILGADIAIVGYGANDIRYFADLATAKAQYLKYWNRLNDLGIKVYACTILPSGQFNTAQNQMKNDLNTWIRTKPSPISKVIEVADLAETARNSNVWKTGYTSDGVHPNITGEVALSAVIVSSDFQ